MVKENMMKQTEIGLLPEDWEVKELVEVAELINGRAYSQFELLSRGKYRVLRVGNFFSSDKWYWSDLELANKFYVEKGDLMYAWSASFGPKFWYSEKTIYHYHIWKVEVFKSLNKHFLYHLLIQDKEAILNQSQGGTMFHITKEAMGKRKFPFPPLPEQEAIAEALSDADAWIESLEQLIAKKRLIKQGAMQELLSPKEDWEVKKLGEVIDVYRGGSPRPIQDFITDKLDGINWIKIGDTPSSGKYIVSTNEKIIPEGEKNSRRVYPGDFLLSNSMSFGRPYILKIDGCIHDGWLVLQNYKSSFDTEFLYYLLTSKYILDQYKSKAAGSGVLNLNKEVVNTVELIIPSLTEQARIATILSDMDAELEALEEQLGKARKVKQGMMQELLTGRVRLV